jgi:type IV pilus assembly protein PilY1
MKTDLIRAAAVAFMVVLNACVPGLMSVAFADDTEIFLANPAIAAQRPNVLIMLDNTANWNQAFANEKSALVTTVNGLDDRFNVGWAGFVETGNPNDNVDGAYVRAAVRQMTETNKTRLAEMVQALDQTYDVGNNATYGLAMAEIYRYFAGLTASSGSKRKRDYSGNVMPATGNNANDNPGLAKSNAVWALPGNAFANSSTTTYTSPISDDCAKNFVIFISNGPANDNANSTSAATSALSGFGGSTSQITLNPNGQQSNVADEWARFMANTDVSTRSGTQNIVTYTIDVNPGTTGQGPDHTALLKSMAAQGKGKYFAVSSANGGAEIADALNKIFQEVLAVNSVFASATLPVSINTRGTFLNQVYMGVFRPDGSASPRWPGNLKQFKTAPNSVGQLVLVDQFGAAVEDTTNGFLKNNISSIWTSPSTFWDATFYPDAQGIGTTSDRPDGDLVEKGGVAQRLRTDYATDLTNRKVYTCPTAGSPGCTANSSLSSFPFSVSGLSSRTLSDFGISGSAPVSSITRSGSVATATTSAAHGLSVGQSVNISGADQAAYNGTFTVATVPSTTQFTFAVVESPLSPGAVTGATVAKAGSTSFTISQITRTTTGSGQNAALLSATATATTSLPLTLANNDSVQVSVPDPASEYNGTYTVSNVNTTTGSFTFTVPVNPPQPTSGNGSVVVGSTTYTVDWGNNKGISRAGAVVTVFVTTALPTGTTSATISGVLAAANNVYNGTKAITLLGGRKSFTYTISLSPPVTVSDAGMSGSRGAPPVSITNITRASGSTTATFTTSAAHGLATNDAVVITASGQPSEYTGNKTVASVPSTTTFTITVPVTPVSPATGTITVQSSTLPTLVNLINWVRGVNVRDDDNPSGLEASVRGYLHGDVVHSRPAVINYNRNSDDNDVVVFYGANDGHFRAIQGGQGSTGGQELWSFIAEEHYAGLGRQYSALPAIDYSSAATSKQYFFDGPVGTYVIDSNGDGKIDPTVTGASGDKAIIYLSMRRGGRAMYALDVTTPATPKLLWRISNTTSAAWSELGQTWAEPKVVKIRGYANPVMFLSAGYDAAANDAMSQGTATMGRGVYALDALTGTPLWFAGAANLVASIPSAKLVTGMSFAIPAEPAPIDSNGDGYVDRLYIADTGGNLWRADVSATNASASDTGRCEALGGQFICASFSSWNAYRIAELGRDTGETNPSPRKFLFSPDVVPLNSLYDAVLIGSGDRERPREALTPERFFMVKDTHALTSSAPSTPITSANLYDATANLIQVGSTEQKAAAQVSLDAASGWYVNLAYSNSVIRPDGTVCTVSSAAGEKVVTRPLTIGGTTVFGTNIPDTIVSQCSSGQACTNGLGEARIYALNFENGSAVLDFNSSGVINTADRFALRAGGGLPPSPIGITVQIDGKIYQGIGTGATIVTPPGTTIGRRSRVFWNMLTESR